MDNISVSFHFRHQHCVDIDLSKKSPGSWNGWWNNYLVQESYLTLMASLNVPLDILIEIWPPEALQKPVSDGVNSFMS